METAADHVARQPRADGMPMMGLGTYRNTDPDQCARSVETAIELGYRHVDTAQLYGNEAAVGAGIAAASVDPDDLFVATKLWHDSLSPAAVADGARTSRDRLGVGSIDLLYIHWPTNTYDAGATLPAFAELVEDGVIDRIGVSNFTPTLLDEAIEILGADAIFANQVELHPLLPQAALREYCESNDIAIVGYAPIARRRVFDVDELAEIAARHDATAAQVSLAWLREKGVTAIPKATGRAHIEENWMSLTVDLSEEDVSIIDSLDRHERLVDLSFGPW